jgi:hypothetical protein
MWPGTSERTGRTTTCINGSVRAKERFVDVELTVTLDLNLKGRAIHMIATPVDEAERLVSDGGSVVFSFWREGPGVIRGSITHASGAVAYFQGGESLDQIATMLRLHVEKVEHNE